MTGAKWLQVSGGALEMIGLVPIVWGISETRAKFKGIPAWPVRAWGAVTDAAARVRRLIKRPPPTQTISGVGGIVSAAGTLSGTGTVTQSPPWDSMTPDERMEYLREEGAKRRTEIFELGDRLVREEGTRAEALREEQASRQELDEQLTSLINEAAAGGLRWESLGALFFFVGVVVQTIGAALS